MSKTIIVDVDETQLGNFQSVVDSLDSDLCMIKIGSVSFNALGHQTISYASNKGFKIFLDLKLHDIPNTVKKSIKGLVSLPIDMMTIHTSGGLEMMKAAKKAVDGTDIKIFGVTALTSLSDDDTALIFKRTAAEQVNTMLDLAEQAGIDGVVCSPLELSLVNKRESLLSITPGIRLKDSNDDQNRVMTPKDALKQGANFLVIGRPITEAKNIKDVLLEIYNSI
jgi:orotidine-5'-phosphate decarboxylase